MSDSHKCPVCNGTGNVSNESNVFVLCKYCSGGQCTEAEYYYALEYGLPEFLGYEGYYDNYEDLAIEDINSADLW